MRKWNQPSIQLAELNIIKMTVNPQEVENIKRAKKKKINVMKTKKLYREHKQKNGPLKTLLCQRNTTDERKEEKIRNNSNEKGHIITNIVQG